jgi:hypothetical protein
MAMGPSYGKALARKSAPPDALEALGDEPDDSEPDDDGDDAEEQSAWEDFARAAGIKPSPAAYSALKELIQICSRK